MAKLVERLTLHFDDETDKVGKDISAVALAGDTLFCACDEGAAIETLERHGDGFAHHRRTPLTDIFGDAGIDGEVDLEGMAIADGYLWLTGSHARTRPKPKKSLLDADGMAPPRPVGSRGFLGCVPLAERGGGRFEPVARDGDRIAACLATTDGETLVQRALGKHPLLAPFVELPAKENGLDVEGLAVGGDQVLLGLRGPVVGRRALVVESRMTRTADGSLEPYRFHGRHRLRLFALDLDGFGIRDLCRDGDRLLLLAGPALAHPGPRAIYAVDWPAGQAEPASSRPERLFGLPAEEGDNAEGIALILWQGKRRLLVVHDTGDVRYRHGERKLEADLFEMPAG